MLSLVKKAIKCDIVFQDGGFMGDNWFELTGEGIDALTKLINKYGKKGLEAFNQEFAQIVKEKVRRKIEYYDAEFQELLPRVVGGPYDMREIANLRAKGADVSNLVTTDDYRATQGVRDHYQDFLDEYNSGKPIKILIPTDSPKPINCSLPDGKRFSGRFAEGWTIELIKPNRRGKK